MPNKLLQDTDSVFLTYRDVKENNPDWTDRMIEDYLALKRDVETLAKETEELTDNNISNEAVFYGWIGKLKSNIQKNVKKIKSHSSLIAELISNDGKLKSLIQKNTKKLKNHSQIISSLDGWIGKFKGQINSIFKTLVIFDDQIGLRETAASGVIEGGLISQTSPTTIDIASGAGEIVDGYTDRRNPTRINISWPDIIGFTIDMPDQVGVQVVYIDGNGVPQQQSNTITPTQRRLNVQIGLVSYSNGVITAVNEAPILSNEVGNQLYDWIFFLPASERVSGLGIHPVDANLQIRGDVGKLLSPGINIENSLTNPHIKDFPAVGDNLTPLTFDVFLADGTIHLSAQTDIPFLYESPLGVVNSLSGNDAVIHYIYRTLNNNFILQLGQTSYADGKLARDALEIDRADYTYFVNSDSVLLSAQCYAQRNAPDFNDPNYAGLVSLIGAGAGSSGGVSVNEFIQLTDVLEPDYVGQAGLFPTVNDLETGLEFTLANFLSLEDVINNDYINQGGKVPTVNNLEAGLEFEYPVNWAGVWTAGTYLFNSMSRDGDYLGIVNNPLGTSDRLEPENVGGPSWDLPDIPAWTTFNNTSVVGSGHDYTFTETAFLNSIRVWVPAIGANIRHRLTVAGNGGASQQELTGLRTGEWNIIKVDPTLVMSGSLIRVYLEALNSSSQTTITGDWTRSGNSNNNQPDNGSWNTDNNNTTLRIDFDDLTSTDRQAELESIIVGSTIEFIETGATQNSIVFQVVNPPVTRTTSVEYDVVANSIGADEPATNNDTSMTATLFVAQSTEFVGIANGWTGNEPLYADVQSYLAFDGIDQGVNPLNQYGISINVQRIIISPDWDIMAISGGSGGGGSDPTNETPVAVTFTNSWVNFGAPFGTAKYSRESNGIIRLSGVVRSGTAGQSIFTLPEGFRPLDTKIFTIINGGVLDRLDITNTGTVTQILTGGNSYVTLDGITFRTDQ